MMSQQSKRELWETIQPRYLRANKAEKHKILDEFVATTGFHCKYAIRILKRRPFLGGLVYLRLYRFGTLEQFKRIQDPG